MDGQPCPRSSLPTFEYCLGHLPDHDCERAQKMGYRRCKHLVGNKDSPRRGERCSLSPLPGSDFCAYHQDEAKWLVPQSNAQRNVVARIYRAAADESIDVETVTNPLQALLELAAETLAFKEELKRRVVALDENEWRYEHVAGEQIRGDIILYERAIDRTERILTRLAKLGIEDRLAKVTERQAHLVEQAIVRAFEEVGLPLDVQDQAREAVGRHLRAAV